MIEWEYHKVDMMGIIWHNQQCKIKLFRNAGFHSILGQPIFDPLVIEDGSGTPTLCAATWYHLKII